MARRTEPLKILIADDYPDAAALLGELLQLEFDCEIVVVLNGADALQEALKRRPDVSLLDIDMPIMSGIECAAAMRLKWGRDAGLIVAITGLSSLQASASGHFDHVLRKPADFDELVKLIRVRFPSNPSPDPRTEPEPEPEPA